MRKALYFGVEVWVMVQFECYSLIVLKGMSHLVETADLKEIAA